MISPSYAQFHRFQILVGENALEKLSKTRVLLLGVGGVGSWCAEALIRNGIGRLDIVDSDAVCVTNVNRQLQALHSTVGQSKVDVLADRLRDIHPGATINAINAVYNQDSANQFDLTAYDYVVDAIDSLSSKVELIDRALRTEVTLFSSMGASCKMDPTLIRVDSFWKTFGCPLAKFVRKRLRNRNVTKDFVCVFSPENLPAHPSNIACGSGNCVCPALQDGTPAHEWCSSKKQINGSSVHITGMYGFYLAALVTNNAIKLH
ncbi:MAG: tRNA threonylcarbamoyladenosine dehydratase [Deltaproteobacteria bacterium]|nr:tRNA threonylcarbamoyladenosine dehydratase [Deltaproteobacteria bacterium]MBN2671481.1 tRNA threonylcarbamoyladenosine dehydratase [Deltaproteobacteria bacterium]